jgi:hypothetical protein
VYIRTHKSHQEEYIQYSRISPKLDEMTATPIVVGLLSVFFLNVAAATVFVNFTNNNVVGQESTGKAVLHLQATGRYSTPITAYVICYSQLGIGRATPVVDFEPSPRNGLPYDAVFNDINTDVSYAALDVIIRDDSSKETDDETFICHILPFENGEVQSACSVITVSIKDDDILDCPEDKIATFGTSPEPSCTDKFPQNTVRVYACHCPEGTFQHRNVCIPEAECPFVEESIDIASGEGVAAVGHVVGDPHYRTFDGLYFDLSDQCYHVLARDCRMRSFSVYSRSSNHCSGGGTRTCVEEVMFEVLQPRRFRVVMKRRQDGTVQHEFEGPEPHPSEVRIVASSDMVTAHSYRLGVTVNFRKWYVSVTVPQTFKNVTCGLLGNYNDDPLDDFQLEDGTILASAFGRFEESWRVGFLDETCNTLDTPQSTIECDSAEAQTAGFIFCNELQNPFGSFGTCHTVISPSRPFLDCMQDRCTCGTSDCGCAAMINYRERCALHGISVGDLPAVCAPNCPSGKSFMSCGPKVASTCADQVGVAEPCASGCFCDNDLVEDETGECVNTTDCQGTIDRPRQNPPIVPSRESAVCTGLGDPHYITFDDFVHHFQGRCVYVFARDCINNTFSVSTYNRPWFKDAEVSYISTVFVKVKGYSKMIRIDENGSVTPGNPPSDIFTLQTNSLGVTLVINTLGVVINYDGQSNLKVKVPSSYQGSMCGLCGNYNSNNNDDFTVQSEGQPLQLTTLSEFGAFWLDSELQSQFECSPDDDSPPVCTGDAKTTAAAFCQYIYNEASFKGCHVFLDPFEFINMCTYDYCAGLMGGVTSLEMPCGTIVDYAGRCMGLGVDNMVLPSQCEPTCPNKEQFSACSPATEPTCNNPLQVTGGCFKKCICAEGLIRHNTRCIDPEKCPITVNFERAAYTAREEEAGKYVVLTADGFVSRNFRVNLTVPKSLFSDGEPAEYSGDSTCGGDLHTQTCTKRNCIIEWPKDTQRVRVLVPFTDNRKSESSRQGLLRLTSSDRTVRIGSTGRAKLTLTDDDHNCIGFGSSVFYHMEGSSRILENAVVTTAEPVKSELTVQVRLTDGTANGRFDYQRATLTTFINAGDQNATFFVFIRDDRQRESYECFYLTLAGLMGGRQDRPPVKFCDPHRSIVLIEDDDSSAGVPSVDNGYTCYTAQQTANDICANNEIVVLGRVIGGREPKDCSFAYQVTIEENFKGSFAKDSEVELLAPPVKGCSEPDIFFGEYYLLAGRRDKNNLVLKQKSVWWGCTQYESILQDIRQSC